MGWQRRKFGHKFDPAFRVFAGLICKTCAKLAATESAAASPPLAEVQT
jgi:hypothetical protein